MEAIRLPGQVKSEGNLIQSIRLRKQRPEWARLHVFPFILLHILVGLISCQVSIPLFWGLFLIAILVALQILLALVQYWFIQAKSFISFHAALNVDDATHVEIVPRAHRGKGVVEPLTKENKSNDSKQPVISFRFQKRLFQYDPITNSFQKLRFPKTHHLKDYLDASQGHGPLSLSDKSRLQLLELSDMFGINELHIPTPTFSELYIEHLLAPFFVFQVFCILLWMLDEYWYYSLMTLGMMMIFEATTVKGRLRSLKELRGMRNAPQEVLVLRNHSVLNPNPKVVGKKWISVSSSELLPGDIVSLVRSSDPEHVVPCDCLLLSGSAVMNEAMLTGESVPLVKEASIFETLTKEELDHTLLDMRLTHKASILFGGTKILNVTPSTEPGAPKSPNNGCVCFVLRTGFGSSQGKLMRIIMYSQEAVSANSKEAAMFLGFLLIFAIFASGYVLHRGLEDKTRSRYELLLHCILIITSVIPPELPMQLALAVNTSLIALSKNGIFCTEPFRIPFAGMIDICCFDKTGTITTDEIRAVGVSVIDPGTNVSEVPETELKDATEESGDIGSSAVVASATTTGLTTAMKKDTSLGTLMAVNEAPGEAAMVLAACNSVTWVDKELVGDPLEIEALRASGWAFTHSDVAIPPSGLKTKVACCKIVSRYRFMSALQRMSVIVSLDWSSVPQAGASNTARAQFRVLTKGSAEKLKELLGVVPDGYDAIASNLARKGMRVLALAYRDLQESEGTITSLKTKPREEIEYSLVFAGFIAFECPLRPDSRKTVRALRKADHQVILITGDALLTAIHVAREVGVSIKPMVYLEKRPTKTDKDDYVWISAQTGKKRGTLDVSQMDSFANDYSLCLSGDIFAAIQNEFPAETYSLFKSKLGLFRVFARARPQQKEDIITALKEMGHVVLMCGDGTNDVGALKQSHVGIALLSFTHSPQPGVPVKKPEEAGASRSAVTASGGASKAVKTMTAAAPANKASSLPKTSADSAQPHMKSKLDELQEKIEAMDADEDRAPLVKLGDASIASAFTSKKMTIDSCVSTIRQGRCTLATTLQMYQILALNCLISSYSLSVLYLAGVKFGDRQMTVVGIAVSAIFFMISRSRPLKKLSVERPAKSVFETAMFLSLLGQFALHLATLMYATALASAHMGPDFDPDIDGEYVPNVLNTVVFLVSTIQQVSVFVTNYKGRPFMEGLQDNKALRNVIGFIFLWDLVLGAQFFPDLNKYFQMAVMPSRLESLPLVPSSVAIALNSNQIPLSAIVLLICFLDVVLSFSFDRIIVWLFTSRKPIILP